MLFRSMSSTRASRQTSDIDGLSRDAHSTSANPAYRLSSLTHDENERRDPPTYPLSRTWLAESCPPPVSAKERTPLAAAAPPPCPRAGEMSQRSSRIPTSSVSARDVKREIRRTHQMSISTNGGAEPRIRAAESCEHWVVARERTATQESHGCTWNPCQPG